jgi:hypothetical protein
VNFVPKRRVRCPVWDDWRVEHMRLWVRSRPLPVAMIIGGVVMIVVALAWIAVANPY